MRIQSFTLLVAVTYLAFLALFLVGMVGNGREGTNEARWSASMAMPIYI